MRSGLALAIVLLSSPAVADMERITFESAVKRALERNPTVEVAVAEIDRAEGLVQQARAGWWPTLVANGSYTRLDHDRTLAGGEGMPPRTITSANQLAGNIQLTVPLLAPTGWANTTHAKDNRRVAESSANGVRRQVATATARAYLIVMAQHRLVAAAETARANAKAHYDFAHARLAGGLGRSIDDVRAQQDLTTVEVEVQAAYTGLARAREALGVLVGADDPVDSVDEVQLATPPPLATALDDARTRRSDVKALEKRVAASQKLVDDVWVYYAPFLAAVGQPFLQSGSVFQPQKGWQAGLVLTLPLYDGGLRSGIGHERRAVLDQARANLEASVRQARSEVRVAFEAMMRADQGLSSAREAAKLAARAYELATLAYQAGATTNLEVIDAARRERDADVGAAQAEDVSRQARLELLVASGRFP